MIMKAYTVYEPFALATVLGLKHYETRPRRTNIRGRVAVHAGMKEIDAALKNLSETDRNNIIAMLHHPPFIENVLYRGGIIGTVEIVDCVPVENILPTLTKQELLWGDYSPGRFAWVLKDPILFNEPVSVRGQQGWWEWKAD